MKKTRRKKAKALLVAAAGAATLLLGGCNDGIVGSGNLIAPQYDMTPGPDQAVPPDLAKKD